MTYAPTVALLEDTALAVGAGSFWQGKEAEADINYNAPFPQVLLLLMNAPLEGAVVKYEVVLYFVGKDEHENGSKDSIQIQDAMDKLSQRFISELRESDDVEVGNSVRRGPVMRKGAGIGTGFVCSFTLTSLGQC
ncbi:MAG: hypothetical protein ACRYG7_13095 [Janthinobacterium lividum]